jgi:hypothetical protein
MLLNNAIVKVVTLPLVINYAESIPAKNSFCRLFLRRLMPDYNWVGGIVKVFNSASN